MSQTSANISIGPDPEIVRLQRKHLGFKIQLSELDHNSEEAKNIKRKKLRVKDALKKQGGETLPTPKRRHRY